MRLFVSASIRTDIRGFLAPRRSTSDGGISDPLIPFSDLKPRQDKYVIKLWQHQITPTLNVLLPACCSNISKGEATKRKCPQLPLAYAFSRFISFTKKNNILSNTVHQNSITKQLNQKQVSTPHLIFHRLSVVLWLEKEAYPENSHVVFCHNKRNNCLRLNLKPICVSIF